MRNAPRRRRSDDEYGRGGLPLFPLVLVVILAGLLLGGGLAHFFGGANGNRSGHPNAVAILPSPVSTLGPVATTAPAPTVTPIMSSPTPAMPAPSASPTGPMPTLTPARLPSAQPRPKTPAAARVITAPAHALAALAHVAAAPAHVAAATAPASAAPAAASAAPPRVTAAPAHVAAVVTPAAVAPDDNASSLVRSYLDALAHGDRTTAATYLTHGLPSESFMNQGARIESIRSASVGPQEYHVTADVFTTSGEYYATFTVEAGPSGLVIADHYWIKPQ